MDTRTHLCDAHPHDFVYTKPNTRQIKIGFHNIGGNWLRKIADADKEQVLKSIGLSDIWIWQETHHNDTDDLSLLTTRGYYYDQCPRPGSLKGGGIVMIWNE